MENQNPSEIQNLGALQFVDGFKFQSTLPIYDDLAVKNENCLKKITSSSKIKSGTCAVLTGRLSSVIVQCTAWCRIKKFRRVLRKIKILKLGSPKLKIFVLQTNLRRFCSVLYGGDSKLFTKDLHKIKNLKQCSPL